MNELSSIWFKYSLIGLAVSMGLNFLIKNIGGMTFPSSEAVVFGVMCGVMGVAVKASFNVARSTEDENSDKVVD